MTDGERGIKVCGCGFCRCADPDAELDKHGGGRCNAKALAAEFRAVREECARVASEEGLPRDFKPYARDGSDYPLKGCALTLEESIALRHADTIAAQIRALGAPVAEEGFEGDPGPDTLPTRTRPGCNRSGAVIGCMIVVCYRKTIGCTVKHPLPECDHEPRCGQEHPRENAGEGSKDPWRANQRAGECFHCGGTGTAEAEGREGECAECGGLGGLDPQGRGILLDEKGNAYTEPVPAHPPREEAGELLALARVKMPDCDGSCQPEGECLTRRIDAFLKARRGAGEP